MPSQCQDMPSQPPGVEGVTLQIALKRRSGDRLNRQRLRACLTREERLLGCSTGNSQALTGNGAETQWLRGGKLEGMSWVRSRNPPTWETRAGQERSLLPASKLKRWGCGAVMAGLGQLPDRSVRAGGGPHHAVWQNEKNTYLGADSTGHLCAHLCGSAAPAGLRESCEW